MKHCILDRLFYKPLWIVSVLFIVMSTAFVKGFPWSYWASFVAGGFYVVVVLLPVFHYPKKFTLKNIRKSRVENPLKTASSLLGSEFRISESYNAINGIKTYGRAGVFRTEFKISNNKDSVLITINTNSPFPLNILEISESVNSIEQAFRSVGYV